MSSDSRGACCSHCGGADLVVGVQLGLNAEIGHIGLNYKDGLLLVGTEPLVVDLCRACGAIERLYVRNTQHRWLAQRRETILGAACLRPLRLVQVLARGGPT